MKKNLLLLLFIMVTTISSAQVTVWEDDFDDANVSDWTLLDRDGDGVNWIARQDINVDESGSVILDGEHSILGNYMIDLTTLITNGRLTENWAITPVVDLSQHSGKKIELILNAQTCIYDTNQQLLVYGSTSTDPDTFELLSTVTLLRQTLDEAEFKDYSVDISQFAGEKTVYIALTNLADINYLYVGHEIDKVSIIAGGNLGVGDNTPNKTASLLKQNPVTENLELQLGNQYETDTTSFQIYNAGSSLVKKGVYNNKNIAVGDLPRGLYFLLLTNDKNSETIKFIKK